MPKKLKEIAKEYESKGKQIYETIEDNRWIQFLDKFIYLAAFIGLLLTIPQIYRVWVLKQANLNSTMIYVFFAGISLAWFIYGLVHKKRAIVITNLGWVIINTLMVVGSEMFR